MLNEVRLRACNDLTAILGTGGTTEDALSAVRALKARAEAGKWQRITQAELTDNGLRDNSPDWRNVRLRRGQRSFCK